LTSPKEFIQEEKSIDIADIKEINRLWSRVYPFLVAQVMGGYRRDSGAVLELGPFSGGISLELGRLYPKLKITIADESPEVLAYLEQEILASKSPQSITIKKTDLNHLAFDDSQFDLLIFRGAFFFLNQKGNLLGEIFRVLKDGGIAFVGGGYGKGVPQKIIEEIAAETRELNKRLGRRRISIEELEEQVRASGLTDNCKIEDEGGLWLVIRK